MGKKTTLLACVFLLFVLATSAHAAITDDLLSLYTFEGTGANNQSIETRVDDYGIYNLTTVGGNAAQTSAGLVGNGYYFDGVGDKLQTASYTLAGSFTMNIWVNSIDVNTYKSPMSRDDNANNRAVIVIDDRDANVRYSNYLRAESEQISLIKTFADTADPTGQWTMLTLSFNDTESKGRFYVNGTLEFVANYTAGKNFSNTMKTEIGVLRDTNNYYKGIVDEVAIWTRAISDSEVSSVYETNLGGNSIQTSTPANLSSAAVNITDTSVYYPDNFEGVCYAKSNLATISYNYTWYANNVSVYNGTLTDQAANTSVSVVGYNSTNLALTDYIKLGCVAYDASSSLSEVQTPEIQVTNSLSNLQSSITTPNYDVDLYPGSCYVDSANASDLVSYNYTWYLSGNSENSGTLTDKPVGESSSVPSFNTSLYGTNETLILGCIAEDALQNVIGEVNSSTAYIFPEITVTFPSESETITAPDFFNYSVVDVENDATCGIYINNTLLNTTSGSGDKSVPLYNYSSGDYEYYVNCTKSFGSSISPTYNISIVGLPEPFVAYSARNPGTGDTNYPGQDVVLSFINNVGGLPNITFYYDGALNCTQNNVAESANVTCSVGTLPYGTTHSWNATIVNGSNTYYVPTENFTISNYDTYEFNLAFTYDSGTGEGYWNHGMAIDDVYYTTRGNAPHDVVGINTTDGSLVGKVTVNPYTGLTEQGGATTVIVDPINKAFAWARFGIGSAKMYKVNLTDWTVITSVSFTMNGIPETIAFDDYYFYNVEENRIAKRNMTTGSVVDSYTGLLSTDTGNNAATLFEGALYFYKGDGNILKINASNMDLIWTKPTNKVGNPYNTPIIDEQEQTVLVGQTDSGRNTGSIQSFSLSDGSEVWSYNDSACAFVSQMSICGDKVIAPCHDNDDALDGGLFAFNRTTGAPLWEYIYDNGWSGVSCTETESYFWNNDNNDEGFFVVNNSDGSKLYEMNNVFHSSCDSGVLTDGKFIGAGYSIYAWEIGYGTYQDWETKGKNQSRNAFADDNQLVSTFNWTGSNNVHFSVAQYPLNNRRLKSNTDDYVRFKLYDHGEILTSKVYWEDELKCTFAGVYSGYQTCDLNETLAPSTEYTYFVETYNASGYLLENSSVTYSTNAAEALTFSNVEFYALGDNQTFLGDSTYFNTGNLSAIEYMMINFSVSSLYDINNFSLFFGANGKGACSLGNMQSAECLNSSNVFIEFNNGSMTAYYDGTSSGGNQGDSITCTYEGSNTARDYSCVIDEHYNPNVFKYYDANFNFSDVKWQNGANQRITGNKQIKIEFPNTISLDADQYKLDFRVQTTGTPTQPLEAYLCNSSYTTGNPVTNGNCVFVAEKTSAQLTDDGTKFRSIITDDLFSSILTGKQTSYIILRTDELVATNYYSIKSYGYSNTSHSQKWQYSLTSGNTWANSNDGYETEMNVNWFYDGADPTRIDVKFGFETNDSVQRNSSVYAMTWTISPEQYYSPLISINTPIQNGQFYNNFFNVTWSANEPNGDNFTTSIYLKNSTSTYTIIENLSKTISNYYFNFSEYLGSYELNVTVCEVNTTSSLCSEDVHNITIINQDSSESPPIIFDTSPSSGSTISSYPGEFVFSVYEDTDDVNCSLYVNGTIQNSTGYDISGLKTISFYNLNNLPDGTYDWYIQCDDTFYISNTTTYQLTIDTTPEVAPSGGGGGSSSQEEVVEEEQAMQENSQTQSNTSKIVSAITSKESLAIGSVIGVIGISSFFFLSSSKPKKYKRKKFKR